MAEQQIQRFSIGGLFRRAWQRPISAASWPLAAELTCF
jgi:hypothetical protein